MVNKFGRDDLPPFPKFKQYDRNRVPKEVCISSVVELLRGGSATNGATPSGFFDKGVINRPGVAGAVL